MSDRDYYCSMKFRYLKIDLESKTTYACHAARPHPVDMKWLEQNPGKLFNNPISIRERQQMLINERNSSCEQNCWKAEDVGAISPRLLQGGTIRTHIDVISQPEIIDLTIGPDCNLTCSYCCKEFSSSWRRDVVNNGDYQIDDNRYSATDKDRVLLKIGQTELKNSRQYQQLLNEIILSAPSLKILTITGGEPFLDNRLLDILQTVPLPPDTVLEIYTGLGVNTTRFDRIIDQLQQYSNLILKISAENTGKFLEFNRYGLNWNDFVSKINLLELKKINFNFHSTLSNLTILDFANFYQHFSHKKIITSMAYQPDMMSPYVLDPESKQNVLESIKHLPTTVQDQISKSIHKTPTEQQRLDTQQFLKEFTRRRPDLDLKIFPKNFLTWVGLDYVV